MVRHAPRSVLQTHEVANQPPEYGNINLYTTDRALRAAVRREAGAWVDERATSLGEAAGAEEVLSWGQDANRNPPELIGFDRFGRRIDEARFHPSYHALMRLAMAHGIHDVAWDGAQERAQERAPEGANQGDVSGAGGHVAHAALLAIFTQAEAGVMCPINMTYAAVPALRSQPDETQPWLDRLVGGRYDAALRPIAGKAGVTVGMAMTEKQGGSDVRANTTRAMPLGGRDYRLTGHKWFCSAPMSDGFLTLAYAEAGLSCFLVPRINPDGERNTIHLMRLKDKLGNRSNASAEIEYHDAYGMLLGEPGQGVKTIIDMVHHTRLGTIAGTLGIMRAALAQAVHHVSHRRAFQKTLIDQAAMAAVVADLAVEYEAAAVLVMRVARGFDAADAAGRAFARLSVAIAKFWLTKRCPGFVFECMECHGGAGYVEEGPMPRLFRESPLNAIWEGSGNVIALDVLRTLRRDPHAAAVFAAEIATAAGGNRDLDTAWRRLSAMLDAPVPEAGARRLAEGLALTLQGALLVRHAPAAVSDAFCATRLGSAGGSSYGILPEAADTAAILRRQL